MDINAVGSIIPIKAFMLLSLPEYFPMKVAENRIIATFTGSARTCAPAAS